MNGAMMTPVIELKNVTMEYRISRQIGFKAARNIDLAINGSEIIAVVGESGCGKSTIGKICLGVLKPTSGQVLLNGQNIWSRKFKWEKKNRHMVQIVHQDSYASLNPLRT
ncbi:MAG: ATP-binding cassette domain-containing protein, partial [Planctomycetota bacterium]